MYTQNPFSRRLSQVLAGLAATGMVFLTGCGVSPFASPAATTGNVIKGIARGGEQPIVGASVRLYETQSNGYGGAGSLLESTTSLSDGSFSFSSGYTCDPGQQAYITASGGSSGGSTNPQLLLMAAVGSCTSLGSGTVTNIDEVTTIAAAYALSGFTTINGTVVNVSAPPNNNASTGSLTSAAGLTHAFLNAANLATSTTGTANTAIVGNTAQVASLNGIVPQAEINALANSLQACINSTGGGATSTSMNDGTNCGVLFSNTPTVSGSVPFNTLQSMINLAQNPYPSAAAVTAIYNLGTPQQAFAPALTTAPLDWDLAITYKLLSYPTNCFTAPCLQTSYPYHLTLDANDNVYVTNPSGSSAVAGAGINLYGISSNGQLLYVNNNSFPASTSASATVAEGARNIAADALGNLWVADNSASVFQLVASTGNPNTGGGGNATTGAFTSPNSSIVGLAVDAKNNVWLGSAKTTVSNVAEIPYSGSNVWGTPAAIALAVNGPYGIAVDANQNIWLSGEYSGGTTDSVLPNTNAGTTSTPAYGAPLSVTLNSGGTPYGVAIDASGNVWSPSTSGTVALNEVVPVLTSGVITSLTSPVSYNANADFTSPRYDEVDGGSVVWIAENSNKGIIAFNLNTLLFMTDPTGGYKPCLVVVTGNAYACGAEGSAGAISGVRMVAIDSTGSVWSPSSTYGTVVQIIGTGTPTWPLLSMGAPATKPQ
jgi:hypothetical protein